SSPKSDSKVLILGVLEEEKVSQALANRATSVVAVDPNPALSAVARASSLSPLNHPAVRVVNLKPRTFLGQTRDRFTQIVLPDAGRFGGSVGLEETEANFLMTTEALDRMWELLEENGTISVTVWMDYPYRYPLRTAVLFTDLLRREKLSPDRHLSAVRSWTDVTFAISKSALTERRTARISAFATDLGFDPLILPGLDSDDRDRSNTLQDRSLYSSIDAITGSGLDRFVQTYEFQMAPPTDNRPYFDRFVRWSSLSSLQGQFGDTTIPFFGLGLFIAVLTFLQGLVLSVVLIVLPVAAVDSLRRQSFGTLVYFASLGLGFMFIEIVLIQKFTLYLGDPVYAVSTVLGVVLVGSGVGAFRSSRLSPEPFTVAKSALVVGVLALCYLAILAPFFDATIFLPLWVRTVIGMALLLPVAYAMGRPFPVGLRMLSERSESQVPWAWGVNGCLSVIGASAAPLISIEWGFAVLLLAGCGAYCLAAAAAISR
ncbi:MAG: hypothetical protein PVF33_12460, partial [Candidatus Latescibacterota bacterium]